VTVLGHHPQVLQNGDRWGTKLIRLSVSHPLRCRLPFPVWPLPHMIARMTPADNIGCLCCLHEVISAFAPWTFTCTPGGLYFCSKFVLNHHAVLLFLADHTCRMLYLAHLHFNSPGK
jgi:hypothetical protein